MHMNLAQHSYVEKLVVGCQKNSQFGSLWSLHSQKLATTPHKKLQILSSI